MQKEDAETLEKGKKGGEWPSIEVFRQFSYESAEF